MKMNNANWLDIRHFKQDENWGDWKKIEATLIYLLDSYRDKIKTPIYVSCGTQGKHCVGSEHYTGEAVDILFPNKLMRDGGELAQEAEDSGFSSIGIYNCWKLQGVSTLGMHLGVRKVKATKRWIGIESQYLPFNMVNIKRYFIDFIPKEC